MCHTTSRLYVNQDLRRTLLPNYYYSWPNTHKYIALITTNNSTLFKQLSSYLNNANKRRTQCCFCLFSKSQQSKQYCHVLVTCCCIFLRLYTLICTFINMHLNSQTIVMLVSMFCLCHYIHVYFCKKHCMFMQ